MKRILYVTTIGSTMNFFQSLIIKLIDEGNVVDIATNDSVKKVPAFFEEIGCKIIPISTSRSPFSVGNIKAIKQIREIAKDYDIVHCHTPLAAMATRIACRKLRKKKGLKVIYTAHGFHFYKGAPRKNWMIYYPIEKICSRWTDTLITINIEDYELAKNKMKANKVIYVPGVGIDVKKFSDVFVDKPKKRLEIGVPNDSFLILSVGELNKNKNHQIVIKAISKLSNADIHYVIAGVGEEQDYLETLALELNVNLHLLGFRTDVSELYKVADCYCLPSIREGLNVSIMEAMASGLPVICSDIRGNIDLVDELGGCLCNPTCVEDFAEAITQITSKSGVYNSKKIFCFSADEINKTMINLYANL